MKKNFAGSLKNALIIVLMAAIWVLFAPVQFGGTASYVIVAGASMEPALHQGDLVIARGSSTYEIGDVTAYQHPQVGPVIHRIVEHEGPHYTLKGDNNSWIDSYEPVDAEILGRSWLHIPGAAEKLLWLRTPLGLSLLSLSIGFMFLITITKNDERQKKVQKQDADMFSRWFQKTQTLRLGEWVFPLAVLLFAAIVLGITAFTRPVQQSIPVDIPYTHQGVYSYQGVGSPTVYEQGQLESGQAIFHALVQDLELDYSYTLETNAPAELRGSYNVLLSISEPSGWQRTIELQPETQFSGDTFTTRANLDLQQITTIVERVKARTGLSRQVFNVDVVIPVTLEGTLAGIDYAETFTATLPFQLDDIEMYLNRLDPLGENDNPLRPSSSAFLPNEESIPNSFNVFGLVLEVQQARQISLIAGGISFVLIALIMTPALAVSLRSESERIKLVYAERLLDVNEIPFNGSTEWVLVADIEALIKLSEATGNLILHTRDGDEHTYALKDGDIGYRLTIHDPNGTDSGREAQDDGGDAK
jgi:signal peptidase